MNQFEDIGQSFYSLIVDESKMPAICIRYFSVHSQEIVTTFLKMVPLGEFATSDAIGDAICKVLKDYGLTLDRPRIVDQWDALKLCFQMESCNDEKCYTTRQFASMYQDPGNYITLIFLEGNVEGVFQNQQAV